MVSSLSTRLNKCWENVETNVATVWSELSLSRKKRNKAREEKNIRFSLDGLRGRWTARSLKIRRYSMVRISSWTTCTVCLSFIFTLTVIPPSTNVYQLVNLYISFANMSHSVQFLFLIISKYLHVHAYVDILFQSSRYYNLHNHFFLSKPPPIRVKRLAFVSFHAQTAYGHTEPATIVPCSHCCEITFAQHTCCFLVLVYE